VELAPIAKPIQDMILAYREEKELSYRDFLEPELRHTSLNNIQTADDKFIQLDTLDKILNKHPELGERIAKYLYGVFVKNITPATKTAEPGVKEALENTIKILREENSKLLNIVELALKRGGTDGTQ
jgi:hypothetical protein